MSKMRVGRVVLGLLLWWPVTVGGDPTSSSFAHPDPTSINKVMVEGIYYPKTDHVLVEKLILLER